MTDPQKYPKALVMSPKVTAKVGFKDSRLQLGVRTGVFIYPEATFSLWPEDLPKVEAVIAEWKAWLALPPVQRELFGAK